MLEKLTRDKHSSLFNFYQILWISSRKMPNIAQSFIFADPVRFLSRVDDAARAAVVVNFRRVGSADNDCFEALASRRMTQRRKVTRELENSTRPQGHVRCRNRLK